MDDLVICCLIAEFLEDNDGYENRHALKSLRDKSDPFSMSDNIFEKNYRFSKMQCRLLIDIFKPHDIINSNIAFEFRFLAALYFYTNGSYQSYIGNNRAGPMSQSSVSRAIKTISNMICEVKQSEVRFPQTVGEKNKIKQGFYSAFGIQGTIGVVDCIYIGVVTPKKNDTNKPLSLYMNRMGYYSINVEAICDHRLVFTSVIAKFPGSCHDSTIWKKSDARQHMLANHSATIPMWLLGDKAYPLEPWLMTPLAEPSTVAEKNYNEIHAKARNVVERAFGALRSRFRCLSKNKKLYYSHERSLKIINACFVLHNICMKNGVPIISETMEAGEEEEEEETPIDPNNNLYVIAESIRRKYIATLH